MRIEEMRVELFRSRAAEGLRVVSSHAAASHVVGFAAEEWVACCTAPGLKWTAQRVDRMGASWRDQTSPHSLENAIVSSIN
jgi:hypothetical protein